MADVSIIGVGGHVIRWHGWRVWVSLVVVGVLFNVERMVRSWVVGDGLVKLALWRLVMWEGMLFVGVRWHVWISLVVVCLLFVMELLVRVFAGG